MRRKSRDSARKALREIVMGMQSSSPHETVFSVPAMTCRHCVRAVSAQLGDVVGVLAVEADATSRTVRVQGTAPPHALRSAIAGAGYEAVVVSRSGRGESSIETRGSSA